MKNKKFLILGGLVLVWVSLYVGLVLDMRINPRIEELVTAILVLWFAIVTVSVIKNNIKQNGDSKEKTNGEDNITDTNQNNGE
jgi:hypothetical protein